MHTKKNLEKNSPLLPQFYLSQATHAGRKAENQDTLAVQTIVQNNSEANATNAWLVTAVADGVSSCQRPKTASQLATQMFLQRLSLEHSQMLDQSSFEWDSEQLVSVDKLAQALTISVQFANDMLYFSELNNSRIQVTQNSQLPSLLTTLTGILFTDQAAVLFHTGDSRVYRFRHNQLSVLSEDHRHAKGRHKGALASALGADARIDLQLLAVEVLADDIILLMTDGVYEHISESELLLLAQSAINHNPTEVGMLATSVLDTLPDTLCQVALENGSTDNVSCIAIGMLPKLKENKDSDSPNAIQRLVIPPVLAIGQTLDNFTIHELIQNTPRSTVYLSVDNNANTTTDPNAKLRIIKAPSTYFEDDSQFLRLFLKEEKLGLSFNHPSLLKFYPKTAASQYLYHVTEYVQGMNLRTYLDTQPPLSLPQVFDIISQVGLALRVMHRNYYLHQDIKPENIMLTATGKVKIIDFGSVGSLLLKSSHTAPVGDLHYTAPEYFADAPKGVYSEIFSIGVMTYEMLTGHQPFDLSSLSQNPTPQQLNFKNVRELRPELPYWVNDVLLRAMHPDYQSRYQGIGDFLTELDPKTHTADQANQPLLEKNPVLFWQMVSGGLFILLIVLLIFR